MHHKPQAVLHACSVHHMLLPETTAHGWCSNLASGNISVSTFCGNDFLSLPGKFEVNGLHIHQSPDPNSLLYIYAAGLSQGAFQTASNTSSFMQLLGDNPNPQPAASRIRSGHLAAAEFSSIRSVQSSNAHQLAQRVTGTAGVLGGMGSTRQSWQRQQSVPAMQLPAQSVSHAHGQLLNLPPIQPLPAHGGAPGLSLGPAHPHGLVSPLGTSLLSSPACAAADSSFIESGMGAQTMLWPALTAPMHAGIGSVMGNASALHLPPCATALLQQQSVDQPRPDPDPHFTASETHDFGSAMPFDMASLQVPPHSGQHSLSMSSVPRNIHAGSLPAAEIPMGSSGASSYENLPPAWNRHLGTWHARTHSSLAMQPEVAQPPSTGALLDHAMPFAPAQAQSSHLRAPMLAQKCLLPHAHSVEHEWLKMNAKAEGQWPEMNPDASSIANSMAAQQQQQQQQHIVRQRMLQGHPQFGRQNLAEQQQQTDFPGQPMQPCADDQDGQYASDDACILMAITIEEVPSSSHPEVILPELCDSQVKALQVSTYMITLKYACDFAQLAWAFLCAFLHMDASLFVLHEAFCQKRLERSIAHGSFQPIAGNQIMLMDRCLGSSKDL